MKYDLFCFGKSNIDYVAQVSDELILDLGLTKGGSKTVKKKFIDDLEKSIKNFKKLPGGSSANVASGFAHIVKRKDLKVAYCGVIGNDENSRLFEEDMKNRGVNYFFKRVNGSCPVNITLITPDAERTFAFFPGICNEYHKNNLPFDVIADSKIFHTDAYELESVKDVVIDAVKYAKQGQSKISFDVASEKMIDKNRDKVQKIIYFSDFIFANENEFKTLIKSTDIEEFSQKLRHQYQLDSLIVKLGNKGALISSKESDELHKIPVFPVDAIDTTGAGDAFAAGFLYGISQNYDVEFSGRIGSFYASKVVSQLGPRLKEPIENIEEEIK